MISVRKKGSAAELQDMSVAAAPAGSAPAAKKARGSDARAAKPPKPSAAAAAAGRTVDLDDDDDEGWMWNTGPGKGKKSAAKTKASAGPPRGAAGQKSTYPGNPTGAGAGAGGARSGVVGQKRPSPDGGHRFDKYEYNGDGDNDEDDDDVQIVSKPAPRAFQIPVKAAAAAAPAAAGRGQKRKELCRADDDDDEDDFDSDDDDFESAPQSKRRSSPPGHRAQGRKAEKALEPTQSDVLSSDVTDVPCTLDGDDDPDDGEEEEDEGPASGSARLSKRDSNDLRIWFDAFRKKWANYWNKFPENSMTEAIATVPETIEAVATLTAMGASRASLYGEEILATLYSFLESKGLLHQFPKMQPPTLPPCPTWQDPTSEEAKAVRHAMNASEVLHAARKPAAPVAAAAAAAAAGPPTTAVKVLFPSRAPRVSGAFPISRSHARRPPSLHVVRRWLRSLRSSRRGWVPSQASASPAGTRRRRRSTRRRHAWTSRRPRRRSRRTNATTRAARARPRSLRHPRTRPCR